ncbi:MAG TPA: hypothetical protein VFE78_18800 [Gemmataceae bacterium]|jgi:hypothetical protein|nr:hypothetical protein [Gemmataceae bacterium]
MAKANAPVTLAGKLLELLRRQRAGGEYPLSVARLAVLAGPDVTAEQALKALSGKAFVPHVALGQKKDPAAPLALAEDADRLAASPRLLDFALNRACTPPAKPLQPLAKVVGQVEKPLRPVFEAALRRRLEEGALPPEAASQEVRGKPLLYLKRFPPPKPPALDLSERLVRALEQQRGRGEGAYPVPLDRLVELTGAAPAALVKKALAAEPFRSQAAVALARQPDAPVALTADCDVLAASPLLLQTVLRAARSADNQAVGLADLKKKLIPPLRQPFEAAIARRIDERSLPAAVGCLRIKKKPHLFLLADLGALAPTPPAAPKSALPAPPPDFARRFEAAFERLDRERGSHNLVSLVGLRRELTADRATFDAELQRLRRAGRYSLSAAEGRHGISAEERDAAIPEDGSLLLFVSRRGP